jgi:dihydroorotase
MTRTAVMADFWPKTTATYEDLLLKHLRPGDILTHYNGRHYPFVDEEDKVSNTSWKARERGVIFDVGHGIGSFWFRIAAPAISQGFLPDSISTDLHRMSVLHPDATMPNVMSKFLNLGMTLEEVVHRSTVAPAKIVKRPDLGTLSEGSSADVGVFELQEGDFTFIDCGHARLRGKKKLECVMNICRGQLLWNPRGLGWPDWQSAGHYYYNDALLRPEEAKWLDRPNWPA